MGREHSPVKLSRPQASFYGCHAAITVTLKFKALKSQLAETLCLISTEKRHGTSLLLGTWVNARWLHWS